MRAGRLTEKLTVQYEEITLDELGGKVTSYTDRYVDVACDVRMLDGTERDDNTQKQVEGELKAQFETRYMAGLKQTDRILWSNGYWDIEAVLPIGRRVGMKIIAVWADNQEDTMSFSEEGAQQVVADTGGLTLDQVSEQFRNNTTGLTFPQLADYYTAQNTVPPRIQYPSFLHVDNWRYGHPNYTENFPYGFDERLQAGELSAGPTPENVLHSPAVDTTNPSEAHRLLYDNNEFGNKFRFTYDDGTEATRVYSTSPATVDNAAVLDGYTGSNPRYIIDNYTGLAWYRSHHGTAAQGEWYTWRGLDQGTAPFSDYVGMLEAVNDITLYGYSDWRMPTAQEFYGSLGVSDTSNWMGGNVPEDHEAYFPPINLGWRGYGGRNLLLGPFDMYNQSMSDANDNPGVNQSWFEAYVPLTISNGGWVGSQTLANADNYASGNVDNWNTFIVRRHFDNR